MMRMGFLLVDQFGERRFRCDRLDALALAERVVLLDRLDSVRDRLHLFALVRVEGHRSLLSRPRLLLIRARQ